MEIPQPDDNLVYPNVIVHYAKGMAYLGKNDIANAEKQLASLNELAKDKTLKDVTIWNINKTYDLVQITNNVLSARVEAKKNNLYKAFVLLNKAIEIEDHLNYNESPD